MKRACPHCRTLVEASDWVAHQQAHKNAAKPSPRTVGRYDKAHKALRKKWAEKLRSGEVVICFRMPDCKLQDRPEGPRVLPTDEWDLGHVDGTNLAEHSGPEHQICNRSTAGRR